MLSFECTGWLAARKLYLPHWQQWWRQVRPRLPQPAPPASLQWPPRQQQPCLPQQWRRRLQVGKIEVDNDSLEQQQCGQWQRRAGMGLALRGMKKPAHSQLGHSSQNLPALAAAPPTASTAASFTPTVACKQAAAVRGKLWYSCAQCSFHFNTCQDAVQATSTRTTGMPHLSIPTDLCGATRDVGQPLHYLARSL